MTLRLPGHLRRCGCSLALVLMAALGPAAAGAQQPIVRDSAGVRIVTHTPEQLDGLRRIPADTIPVLSIGALDGPPGSILDDVRVVVSGPDGAIVVADNGGTVIRRYDASGRYLGSSGREGDGPGEFRRIDGLSWLPGDSLVAYERSTGRVSILDPNLEFARSLNVRGQLWFNGTFNSFGAGNVYGLGSPRAVALASREHPLIVTEPTIVRDTARLLILDPSAGPSPSVPDPLRLVPGPTLHLRPNGFSNVQFGADPFLGGNDTGFFYADGARPEVLRFETDGSLRWIFRVDVEPRPVSRAEREEIVEARRARRPDDPAPAIADHHPLITSAHLDAAGSVWLRVDEAVTNDGGRWLLIGPDGTPEAWHDDFPESPRHIAEDHLLAIGRDELGVQRVLKFRIGR